QRRARHRSRKARRDDAHLLDRRLGRDGTPSRRFRSGTGAQPRENLSARNPLSGSDAAAGGAARVNAALRAAPASVSELGELVAECDARDRAIHVVGGNTLAGMGFPPERADVTLETTGLTGAVEYEPADLTLAARCGTPIQSLSALLATHRQFVPFDAPRPQYATLGGTLAAGWLGPRRHLYGRPRDYVIGTTVVLADGTVTRAGGMVVKNVAGYDLSRFYVGSFGTLAILAQANLKTL